MAKIFIYRYPAPRGPLIAKNFAVGGVGDSLYYLMGDEFTLSLYTFL